MQNEGLEVKAKYASEDSKAEDGSCDGGGDSSGSVADMAQVRKEKKKKKEKAGKEEEGPSTLSILHSLVDFYPSSSS